MMNFAILLLLVAFASIAVVVSGAQHKQTFTLPAGSSGMRQAFLVDAPRKKLFVATYTDSKIYTLATANVTCGFPCLSSPADSSPISSTSMGKYTNAVRVAGKDKAGTLRDKGFFFGDTPGRFLVTNLQQSPMSVDSEFYNSTETHFFRAAVQWASTLFVFSFPATAAAASAGTYMYAFKEPLEGSSVAFHALNYEVRTFATMTSIDGAVASPPPKGSADAPPIAYLWSKTGIYKLDTLRRQLVGSAAVTVAGEGISPLNTVAVSMPEKDSGGQLDEFIWAVGQANGLFVVRYPNKDETSTVTAAAGSVGTLEPSPIDTKQKKLVQLHTGTQHTIVGSRMTAGNLWLLDRDVKLHRFSTSALTVPEPTGTAHGKADKGEASYSAMELDGGGTAYVACDTTPVRIALFTGVIGDVASSLPVAGGGPSSGTVVAIVVILLLAIAIIGCIWYAYNNEKERETQQFEAQNASGDDDVMRAAAGDHGSQSSHAIRRLDGGVDASAGAVTTHGSVHFTDLSRLPGDEARDFERHSDHGGNDDDEEMQPPFSPPPM